MFEEDDFDILPVEQYKENILRQIKDNQILICIGETGSGKSTKIPQFVVDDRSLNINRIVVTQPRRVAAINLAKHISNERKCLCGSQVGYSVRFDNNTSKDTIIKFVTDGVLVRELLADSMLNSYDLVMLDEAHERSLNTDILFGFIKKLCIQRPSLKVVITSATLDSQKYSTFFNNCPVLLIPGRSFPVDIYHSRTRQIMTSAGPLDKKFVDMAVDIALQIHQGEEEGHILVFLTGKEDIELACRLLNSRGNYGDLVPMPLYSALPFHIQQRVFTKLTNHNQNIAKQDAKYRVEKSSDNFFLRKCIFSTNIAETSITVPHVRFVIDSGFIKQKAYDPDRHMESLVVVPISQVSSEQRAGRAGRMGPGKCYRLYSTDCFTNMMKETIPEILRNNLSNTVLYLKVIGIENILQFDFLTPPNVNQIVEALIELHSLGAVTETGSITPDGVMMSKFSLEPSFSRCLLGAAKNNCLVDAVTAVSFLAAEGIWYDSSQAKYDFGRMKKTQNWSDREWSTQLLLRYQPFFHRAGDHITFLEVFRQWQQQRFSREFCDENFLNHKSMVLARKIRSQILTDCISNKFLENKDCDSFVGLAMTSKVVESLNASFIEGFFKHGIRRCGSLNSLDGCRKESIHCLYQHVQSDSICKRYFIDQLANFHSSSVYSLAGGLLSPPDYAMYIENCLTGGSLYLKGIIEVPRDLLLMKMRSWFPSESMAEIVEMEASKAATLSSSKSSHSPTLDQNPTGENKPKTDERSSSSSNNNNNNNNSGSARNSTMSNQSNATTSSTTCSNQTISDAKERYLKRKRGQA